MKLFIPCVQGSISHVSEPQKIFYGVSNGKCLYLNVYDIVTLNLVLILSIKFSAISHPSSLSFSFPLLSMNVISSYIKFWDLMDKIKCPGKNVTPICYSRNFLTRCRWFLYKFYIETSGI